MNWIEWLKCMGIAAGLTAAAVTILLCAYGLVMRVEDRLPRWLDEWLERLGL